MVLPDRDPRADHDLRELAPARLEDGARLDRGARGRGRRLRDGHPADAHEALGLRDRRRVRRRRRRLLRLVHRLGVPDELLLQHLGARALHGHRRRHGEHLRRDVRRDPARVPEPEGPRQARRRASTTCSARSAPPRTSTSRSTSS